MLFRSEARSLHTAVVACFALLGLALTGCGDKGVMPVKVTVLLDQKPLDKASVSFIRTGNEKGRAALGTTDDQGIAKLTTYEPHDGALPGSYAVVIHKAPENARTFKEIDVSEDPEALLRSSASRGGGRKKRRARVRTVIPELYSKVDKTPLNCVVSSSGEEFTFELQSDIEK